LHLTEEIEDLAAILSWPVEWSSLHGIAEIKTPLLKLITDTDAFACKHAVRRGGDGYPTEGAMGLNFPYSRPTKNKLSSSAGFRRGLEHKVLPKAKEACRNGFPTFRAMDKAHAPIVSQTARVLAGSGGRVVDLGCGNGALLLKILGENSAVEPFGFDRNASGIAIARKLMPAFSANFHVGDIWNERLVLSRNYRLSLLSLRRLSEVPIDAATAFLRQLRALSQDILVYSYDNVAATSLDDCVRLYGLDVSQRVGDQLDFRGVLLR
jgi:SAM-dependent methyltransferase